MQSSLTKFQPHTPWTDEELKAKATKLWHETGALLVRPSWLKNDFDKQYAQNIGVMMFGKRGSDVSDR